MNIFSLLGFIIALAVLGVGLRLASDNTMMFVDFPSMFIVLGGTLAATAICFQLDRLFFIMKFFFQRMFLSKKTDYKEVISELMQISDSYRKGQPLSNFIDEVKDPFLKEALVMINDGIMENDFVVNLMDKRANKLFNNHMEEAKKIKTLGKFPPAFGMMGTTIGMIVLLANLGGEDAMKMIGPAMGVCLITTLYGVVVANLFFIPAGENLVDQSKETYTKNVIIVEGVKLLLSKTNPIIVAEELNSFLNPNQRLDWKEAVKGQ